MYGALSRLGESTTDHSQDPNAYPYHSVGVICACLPTLRPLFMKLFPKSGLETRIGTVPNLYATDRHRPRDPHDVENFERIPEYQLRNFSPGGNSNSSHAAIIVTREVEQEHQVGKLSMDSTEEIFGYKR
jgi:hypothetical protein